MVKQKYLILFTLVFLNFVVMGKQKFGLDLGVGIKIGLNTNKMIGSGWMQVYKTDPHAGFFLHLNKHKIGIHLETYWTQNHMIIDSTFKGLYQQYHQNFIDSLEYGSFKFNTISIPILINYKLTQWLWIQLGPQFNSNVSVADKDQIIKSGLRIIKQKSYHAVGGVWIQFGGKAPLVRLNMGARFITGLNNLNAFTSEKYWKNQMIQIHVGISY